MTRAPLISPEALRALLAEEPGAVTVLDVRYRMGGPPGLEEYRAGHVPGAAHLDLDVVLAAPAGAGGRHPLPDVATLAAGLRDAGVRRGVPVVVYDDWGGRAAARCWWLLRHHGPDDVRVLDGGWPTWQEAGGPVETGEVAPAPGDVELGPGRSAVVGAEEVLDVAVLIDARAPQRYRGEVEPVDAVAGRIPGAVNVPTEANLREDGRFRSVEELRETYAAVGAVRAVEAGEQVAVYCGSGVTAAHDVLALAVAGIDAALYPGSWSGWITDPTRPIERG